MTTQERIDTICENFWGKFAWCDLQNSEDSKRMNDWLRTTLTTLVTKAREDVRAERDREIVKWIKKHSRFAYPQIPKDESDKRWEIHYTGYREAVNDLITHLTQ